MKYLILGLILIIMVFCLKKCQENFEQNGIYKKTPFRNNSLKIFSAKRDGVLMNLRPEITANTYSYDLDYNDMNRLLNFLLDEEYNFTVNNNILGSLSENIVKRINQKYDEFELNSEFHINDERKYELINFDILIDKSFSKMSREAVINIQFYKKLKDTSYTIQVIVNYSESNLNYKIKKIDIISIDLNEHILMNNKNKLQKYCTLTNLDNLGKCHGDEFLDKEEMRTFFKKLIDTKKNELSKKEIKFLKDKEDEYKKHMEYRKYKCFDNDGFNESTCRSYSFMNGKKGTWDKPCINDKECPFFKKNKNYPNKRGGCKNGFCEFPVNMKRFGYKFYDKNIKPFCHGCNIKNCLGEECFTCCNTQKKNKNLKSPDYMFKNDTKERSKFFK